MQACAEVSAGKTLPGGQGWLALQGHLLLVSCTILLVTHLSQLTKTTSTAAQHAPYCSLYFFPEESA